MTSRYPHPSFGFGQTSNRRSAITSTLYSSTLVEASVTFGSAALAAEVHKHNSNDPNLATHY